jgi:hypothetical protein
VAERRQPLTRLARALGTLLAALTIPAGAASQVPDKPEDTLRVATFNAAMARKGAGVLIDDIAKGDDEVLAVAEIVLRVRADIILINEIDHDPQGIALSRFAALLAEGTGGLPGLAYPHTFTAPVNTGVPSGHDLDRDGRTMGPRDALGFGRFPGQYGMAVLSRVPLGPARTFRSLLWSDIPWAEAPRSPDGTPWYTTEAWAILPMSSKSHWDLTATLPDGRALHLLASHPTPPVFDGPEDRNGLRNAAEIRFWIDYIDGAAWMIDDEGVEFGLTPGAHFVILGDLNADPERGDGHRDVIAALLAHPGVTDPRPASPGGAAAGRATDTADWPEDDGPGNLRVDYVLPSSALEVSGAGVFWPAPGDPLARLVGRSGDAEASSDHRLVWVDIVLDKR